MGKYSEIIKSFDVKSIPDLDVCVLGALELFSEVKLPKIKIPYKRPLVVGSGNAEATGRIIFEDRDAIFANESNFEGKLKNIKDIDGVVLVSASGGKHGPIIARASKKYKKHVTLITNTSGSLAEKEIDRKHRFDEFVFPKQREPYTYNTSTYMGMILGKTREDPKKIKKFVEGKVGRINFGKLKKYKKFYLIVPARFSGIIRMLNVKFIELFGRQIAHDVESSEYVRHATTVVPSDELFISFGEKNVNWGKNRLFVPLSGKAGYAEMMAVSYFVMGKIQGSQKDWFKKNLESYMKKVSKIFGQKLKPIVE